MNALALDQEVHHMTRAEAEAELAWHLEAKPFAEWSTEPFQAWLERKALLELWVLIQAKRESAPEPPLSLSHTPRRRKSARRHRRFGRFGVIA